MILKPQIIHQLPDMFPVYLLEEHMIFDLFDTFSTYSGFRIATKTANIK